jgi:hypothetical protein
MRTTPPDLWTAESTVFDDSVRETGEKILGITMSDKVYEQASTSSSVGGLSLRKCSDHALGAFAASWHESKSNAGEDWVARADIAGCAPLSQRSVSHEVDMAKINLLIATSGPREARNLERIQAPHATAWLSAVPSHVDGVDNVMPSSHFRIAVKRLLSLPILKNETPCPFCKQTMNIYGDHALCCRKSGDNITRHSRVRNLLDKFAEDGLLSPVMEKQGILGHDDNANRRPGDVTIPVWAKVKGLAIDVAVICPLVPTNMAHAEPCEEYGESIKHAKYDGAFVDAPYPSLPPSPLCRLPARLGFLIQPRLLITCT